MKLVTEQEVVWMIKEKLESYVLTGLSIRVKDFFQAIQQEKTIRLSKDGQWLYWCPEESRGYGFPCSCLSPRDSYSTNHFLMNSNKEQVFFDTYPRCIPILKELLI